jgi:hypothetical protein
MSNEPDRPDCTPTWDEGIATLLGKLPGLAAEGHLTINDTRVIQYLAARRTAALS